MPLTWEGWTVLAVFFALVFAGSIAFAPPRSFWLRYGYITVISLLLVGVCYAKGEPQPRRRSKS